MGKQDWKRPLKSIQVYAEFMCLCAFTQRHLSTEHQHGLKRHLISKIKKYVYSKIDLTFKNVFYLVKENIQKTLMLLNIEMRVKCTTIVENSSISIFKTVKSSWGGRHVFWVNSHSHWYSIVTLSSFMYTLHSSTVTQQNKTLQICLKIFPVCKGDLSE